MSIIDQLEPENIKSRYKLEKEILKICQKIKRFAAQFFLPELKFARGRRRSPSAHSTSRPRRSGR
jgi:hypothetical protein